MAGRARKTQTATERLEARVVPEQKALFQRAAALRGVSLKAFMIDSMREAAVKTLEQHEQLKLTIEERQNFIEALLNPPSPNEALRSATRRYNKLAGS